MLAVSILFKFLATTIKGMEDIAAREIEELGGCNIELKSERVFFHGDANLIYRVNIRSRCIHKLMLILDHGRAMSLSEIYRLAKSIEYSEVMGLHQTFAVKTTRVGKHDYTSIDISATVGQAIIDYFNEVRGSRPRVDLKNPDVEISVYVKDDEVTIGVNTTGESLHRRNYRVYDHPAAIKTTLASCMIRLSGWHGEEFLDPMCGGGTIPIEAALMARNFPPGFFRKNFAFTRLLLYDLDAHKNEMEEALEEANRSCFKICGFDISPKHVNGAIANASSAGVDDTTSFFVQDATREDAYRAVNAKHIIVNPPYGIRQCRPRILKDLYAKFLKALSCSLSGSILVLITGAPRIFEGALASINCKVVEVRNVKHGDLPAKVYKVMI